MSPSTVLSAPDMQAIVPDLDVFLGKTAVASDTTFFEQLWPPGCAGCRAAISETSGGYVKTVKEFEMRLETARRAHSYLWLI